MTTVVIGAGLSGLTRGWALHRAGHEVLVLEESDVPGGVVRSGRRGAFFLEYGPNTVRPTPQIWDTVCALGLESEAVLGDPRAVRFVDFGGRLHRVPASLRSFLGTSLLSTIGKLRIFAEPFARRGAPGDSVHSFFERRLGIEVAERLVGPFVSGIFAGDASQLSVSATFPTLARWEREHGSLLAGALSSRMQAKAAKAPPTVKPKGLLSFREGLAALPRALAGALGDRLQLKTRVHAIAPTGKSWRISTSMGDLAASDVVVSTPASRAARLVEGFCPSAAFTLDRMPYASLVVLHLAWPVEAFPAPLAGFGHLVAPQRERRILGALYSSAVFPDRAPQGFALLTVFLGGVRDPEALALSDRMLAEIARRDLESAVGVRGEPEVIAVTRYSNALPQYDFGHEARMAALAEAESGWKGLTFLGNYRGGVSVGDVVKNGLTI